MRGIAGSVLVFLLAASLTGIVVERGGHGAHQFDLGPESEVASGQMHAVGLDAPGGIRTARRYPRFTAVYVTRTPGGSIAIFPNATPIAGCLLVWRPPTSTAAPAFMDPCAGGQWDEQGRYVSGPERQDLLRLMVTVSGAGRLLIDTLDVSPSSPAEIPPEAMLELPPPNPSPTVAGSGWTLIPAVARPPRSERSWVAGRLITLGREWGISAADAAVLLVSLGLVVGAVTYGVASVLRAHTRRAPGNSAIYLEWRDGRRWSRYPEPAMVLAPGGKRSVRVRLANESAGVVDGVSVLLEAPQPLLLDLDARVGTVARSVLSDDVHLRWEFGRRLRPGGRSGVETLHLSRSADSEVVGLTRVIVVRCGPAGGGAETATHVVVQLV